MKHSILFALLLGLTTFFSCKKDKDTTPKVDVSFIAGEWERGSTLYRFSTQNNVEEVLPIQGFTPDPITIGTVYHEFVNGHPSPIPDEKFTEKGKLQIIYAQTGQLIGVFHYTEKHRLIFGEETPANAGDTDALIQWYGDEYLYINGSRYTLKE